MSPRRSFLESKAGCEGTSRPLTDRCAQLEGELTALAVSLKCHQKCAVWRVRISTGHEQRGESSGNMEMQGMGAALLGCWRMLLKWEQLYKEHPATSRVPIPTQNSPKSCLDLEQEDFRAQQVPDPPLCSPSHCPTAVQVVLFISLGRNFPRNSGVGSVPAQTTAAWAAPSSKHHL